VQGARQRWTTSSEFGVWTSPCAPWLNPCCKYFSGRKPEHWNDIRTRDYKSGAPNRLCLEWHLPNQGLWCRVAKSALSQERTNLGRQRKNLNQLERRKLPSMSPDFPLGSHLGLVSKLFLVSVGQYEVPNTSPMINPMGCPAPSAP
jgi:hypothetical protein